MVVEDDFALRKSMVMSLKRFGFDVAEAENGQIAVELFAQQQDEIEAMVVDGMMPILDGFGTITQIRAFPRGSRIPILMVTGMSEAQAIEQAYAAGASDFIPKPVHLGVLAHRLKHLIANTRLQDQLDSARSTFATAFAAMPSGVILTDAKGEITQVNPACEKLFSWPPEAMLGLPLGTIFANSDDAARISSDIFKAPLTSPAECQLTNARERPFWAELLGAPITSETGKPLGAVVVVVDATERRRAQIERERTGKIDLLGLLAGGIAHDFNNILTAVTSSVTLAKMELDGDSPAMVYLNDTQPALEQARALSRQLLTFSKGGAPVRKLCDVGKLTRETIEFSLRGSKLAPVFDIPEGAWPAEVDEGQIGQVLSNLAVNADQASSIGGKLYVALKNQLLPSENQKGIPAGDYLEISVRDEGCGIPFGLLNKIFDPYFTTKKTGNGLGLATVHSIIKRHGGTIEVASREGQGTTFTIWLPAASKLEVTVNSTSVSSNSSGAPSRQKRVLLLEDQDIIRISVGRLLEKSGCVVCACESGEKAVEACRNADAKFDLAILDMTLPGGMSGLETFKQLREIDPELYGVVSSGYAEDPVMAEPERYGFGAVLPKPYSFESLKLVLAHAPLRPAPAVAPVAGV